MISKTINKSTSHQSEPPLCRHKLHHCATHIQGNERHRDTLRKDSNPLRIWAPAVSPPVHRHGTLGYSEWTYSHNLGQNRPSRVVGWALQEATHDEDRWSSDSPPAADLDREDYTNLVTAPEIDNSQHFRLGGMIKLRIWFAAQIREFCRLWRLDKSLDICITLRGPIITYVVRGCYTVSRRLGQIGRRMANSISKRIETITVYGVGGVPRITLWRQFPSCHLYRRTSVIKNIILV